MPISLVYFPDTANAKIFKASGGDVPITISLGTVLANSGMRQSTRLALPALPRTSLFAWKARAQHGTVAPSLGAVAFKLYWSNGDGSTYQDGNLGATDAAVTGTDRLNNMTLIGTVYVNDASTTLWQMGSGQFSTLATHGVLLVRNESGQNMTDFEFILTPMIQQLKAD